MESFFDKDGYLNLDEAVMNSDSFKKIMEDDVVTDAELTEQTQRISDLFRQLEKTCNKQQIELIRKTFTELGVLYAVYNYKELKSI